MAPKQKRAPHTGRKSGPSSGSVLARATKLVHEICCVAGDADLIENIRQEGWPKPLARSIERFDTPALFDWLVRVINFAGVSDQAAREYLRKHASVTWLEVSYRLSKQPQCPKLLSYWHFHQCGYTKQKRTCARPDLIARCPLPKHKLRNGRLNQTVYSLYLFLRDIADEDLVNWIDSRLSQVSPIPERSRLRRWRESLLGPLRHVFGLGDKILSMAFSDLLLAAQDARTHWHELGGSFVAVDTLVHKFFSRTGIIKTLGVEHPYGPACYGEGGCKEVLGKIARRIDAQEFNKNFPKRFPRFVQHAIWRYCAIDELNVCNSVRIPDTQRCKLSWCRVYGQCARNPIAASN